jgi:thiamine biosynthesis lipoprotein
LSAVNRGAYKAAVKLSEPLFEVLQKSITFSRETNSAFDVTVGPLVDLFRSAEEKQAAPSKQEIAQAKSKAGFQKLKLDEQNRTVRFAVEGMRLDLGGIAKGYAVDKAVEAMQKGGAIGGMVDVGGDIRCFGAPPRGRNKWLIGLQDPSDIKGGKTLLVLKLTNAAITTSGDYRRFTLIGGKKYSHIIDTATGCSSEGLASVTIIAKDAVDADALATAVSVMGAEKGLALIETKPETEAILISSAPQYQLIKTTGAENFIK